MPTPPAERVSCGKRNLSLVARRRALDRSDTLLIFLLEARRPHTYRDNARVGVMHHEYGHEQTAAPPVDHAAVLDVLASAGLIAPPQLEP